MKRNLFIILCCTVSITLSAQHQDCRLWYDKPAKDWNEALPVRNGRMGAMVYGDYRRETIQLNEESLWAGAKSDANAESAAIDYAAKNIRINSVCSGVIRTPMAEGLMQRNRSLEQELVREIPAGRLGKPEEIANAVLWLCSPQASFIDGHALLVDGAFSIH